MPPAGRRAAVADGRLVPRLLAALVVASVLAVPVAVLALLVGHPDGPVARLDLAIASGLHHHAVDHPLFVSVLKAISAVGHPSTFRIGATVAALLLVLASRPRIALWVLVTTWGGALLGVLGKTVVGRARPALPDPVSSAIGYSFPSGHALGSFVGCAVFLLLVLPALGRVGRVAAWAACAVVVVAVGFSRLGLGVHYLSDVVGAWLVGLAWVAATVVAFQGWRRGVGLRPVRPTVEGLEPEGAERDGDPRPLPRWWVSGIEIGRHVRAVWWAWLLVLGGAVGLGLLVARVLDDGPLGRLDRGLARALARGRTPTGDTVSAYASGIGETPTIVLVTLGVYLAGRTVFRRWHESTALMFAVVGEVLAFLLVTVVVSRPRPPVPHLDPAPPTSSFPSGHVAASVCCYGMLAILVAGQVRRRWFVLLAVVVAAGLPLLVAWARLYRGMHHLSDVVAGALFGGAWLAAVVLLVLRRPCPPEPRELPLLARRLLRRPGPAPADGSSGTGGLARLD